MTIIPYSSVFDQQTMTDLLLHDPVAQRYRAFFSTFDWSVVPEPVRDPSQPGKPPHPQSAYLKALLVKLQENLPYCTRLHRFLIEHPLLVLEVGFRPHLDSTHPYGFDLAKTVPSARWLREQQRILSRTVLQRVLMHTVEALREEVPGLGEVVAFDVTHQYAWVHENNPRVFVEGPFNVSSIPKGDPDCRLGVKKKSNQEQPDGSVKQKKESLFGYGSGIATCTDPVYGDIVLAEYTQPFNEGDITYYLPLYIQTIVTLGFFPTHITADAAYDAWYCYPRHRHARWHCGDPSQLTWTSPESARLRWRPVVCQRATHGAYLRVSPHLWLPRQTVSLSPALSTEDRSDVRSAPVSQGQGLCQRSQLGERRRDACDAGS